jgi:hypothetical protein
VKTSVVAAAFVVVASVPAAAITYVVSADGLGDYSTIQAAVDVAVDGDTIELTDETFTGDGNRDIVVPSVSVLIRSQGGDPTACIIDCQGSARDEHRGFHFTSTGSGTARLQDIGIMNGYVTTDGGGGIWIQGADSDLVNCIVYQCTAVGGVVRGGGLYVSNVGGPWVRDCIFTGNTGDYGGGVAVAGGGGFYERCAIIDNEATSIGGGLYVSAVGTTEFSDCEIVSNIALRAGGVRLAGFQPLLTDCDISRNEATTNYAGGLWLQAGSAVGCTIVDNATSHVGGNVYCGAGTGTLTNCIIAFSESGGGVYATDGDLPTMSCCDVYGNAGGDYGGDLTDQTGLNDNISEDPQFCGLSIADYKLHEFSPCLPGGNDCGVQLGAYEQGCDSPVEKMSWGRVKSMWR